MTTENFMELWCDTEIRQHIVDVAKRFTRRRDWQKELVCYAWFVLGEAHAQRTGLYYKTYARIFMKKRLLEFIYLKEDKRK